MELIKFRDTIYGRFGEHLFIHESTWDSFRPLTAYGWNGIKFEHMFPFTEDIWDPYYGYGSLEMKQLCKKLLEETELDNAVVVDTIEEVWRWSRTPTEWWKDRPIVFASPCVPQDISHWKKYLNTISSKAKTLRQRGNTRTTRRN